MTNPYYTIRTAKAEEFEQIGDLMVTVYSALDGFPTPQEQPQYYEKLRHIGEFANKPKVDLLVAVSDSGEIGGAVVYFEDMSQYGSGGTAPLEKQASGFRLLAVDPEARGQGIGKLLTLACIQKAKESPNKQLIIHSTKAMQIAWAMYEKMGFKRSEDLDFMQGELQVYGFRLHF